MRYVVHGEELSGVFANASCLVCVMMSLSDYPQLLTKPIPRGALLCPDPADSRVPVSASLHRHVLSSTGDGWHVWIWPELLVEPEILGRAREK